MPPPSMTFYDVVHPIHLISKLSGISIFTINRKDFKIKFTIYDFLLLVLTSIISFRLNQHFWNSFAFQSRYLQSQIVRAIFPFLLYGKFFINVICMVLSFFFRNKMADFIRKIDEIDFKVVLWATFEYYVTEEGGQWFVAKKKKKLSHKK